MHSVEDGRGKLGELLGRPPLPPGLARRVETSLEAEGLLRHRRSPRIRPMQVLAGAAAALLCFLAGATIGGGRGDATGHAAGPLYAFLLMAPDSGAAVVDDIEEHRRWAAALIRDGHQVAGEALASEGTILDATHIAGAPTPGSVAGFFLVSAPSEAEAVRIAQTLPHVAHGGKVVVRRVIPT